MLYCAIPRDRWKKLAAMRFYSLFSTFPPQLVGICWILNTDFYHYCNSLQIMETAPLNICKKKIRRSKQKHSLNLSFPTQSLWTGSPNWWNDQLLAYRITSPYVLNHWLESFVYLQKKETNKNSLQHVAPQKKSHLYPDSRIYYLPWPLLSLL